MKEEERHRLSCEAECLAAERQTRIVEDAMREWEQAAGEHGRASAVFRPRVFQDGDQWCALYGENITVGVCGFGSSPEEACRAFDIAWYARSERGVA